MGRKKKDTNSRKKQLVDAATKLFFSKGYTDTSVRDILNETNDRTASPSVFYYYFKSKEDIYNAVQEKYSNQYISDIKACIKKNTNDPELIMDNVINLFLKMLLKDRHVNDTVISPENFMYILKLKEEITQVFVEVWKIYIRSLKWFEADDEKCHRMALFIAGGIGEMLFEYKYIGTNKDKDSHKFIEEMIEFCVNTLDAPDEERKRYRKMILQHVSEMKRG